MSAAQNPVFWVIKSESGWLLRRFWRGEYDTLSIHKTKAEAVAALAERNNLASRVCRNSTKEV